MPVSDYTSAVGGGLKLKGVKDGGVKKAKKHKKTKDKPTDDQLSGPNDEKTEDSAVQAASSDEKSIEVDESSEFKGVAANKYGKTEAQLRHEERRRQMVSTLQPVHLLSKLTMMGRWKNVPSVRALRRTRNGWKS